MKKMLRNKLKIVRHRVFLSKLALLLLTSLCLAAFFADNWLQTDLRMWQHDSEALVVGRAYQMQTGAPGAGGLMLKVDSKDQSLTEKYFLADAPLGETNTYWHGIGLHATAAGLFNRVLCLLGLAPLARLSTLYFVVIWSFFAVLGAACYWAWRELGPAAALLCGVGTMCSSWTLRSIGNLYWLTALYLLPFVAAAWMCRRYEMSEKLPLSACLLVAASVLLRFACGFEFASTTLICMEVPIIYYWVKHPQHTRKWFSAALRTGLFSLAAFAVALVVWMAQMTVGFGSFIEAWKEMLYPIVVRTGIFSDTVEMMRELAESLVVPPLEIVRMYLQDDTILGPLTMQTFLLVYGAMVAATSALCAVKHNKKRLLQNAQLAVMCAVAFLAPVSWFVLGRGHAYIHTHIDYILWLFPLLPCMLSHLGVCLATWRELWAQQGAPHRKENRAGKHAPQKGGA